MQDKKSQDQQLLRLNRDRTFYLAAAGGKISYGPRALRIADKRRGEFHLFPILSFAAHVLLRVNRLIAAVSTMAMAKRLL